MYVYIEQKENRIMAGVKQNDEYSRGFAFRNITLLHRFVVDWTSCAVLRVKCKSVYFSHYIVFNGFQHLRGLDFGI